MKSSIEKSARETHRERQILWHDSISRHQKYIDPNTAKFSSEYVEQRSCPVCLSTNFYLIFHKEGGEYQRCRDCSMVFLNPVLTDDAILDFYKTNHGTQSKVVEEDLMFYQSIYKKGLDLVSPFILTKSAILDYGCSSGIFLNLAAEENWKLTCGLELNKIEAQIAKKNGHRVQEKTVFEANFPEKFDLITLWDVFEHIKNGHTYMAKFRDLLKPNGVIFLQVPNVESLAARTMKEECNMFDGLEHVNLYSPSTIKKMADNNGFDLVAITTVISEINVLNNYLNYEDAYSGSMPSTTELLPQINENYIFDNMLGYKLQVVLTKKT